MKLKLYIDFDGVILDTIRVTYDMLKEKGITDYSAKNKQVIDDFYRKLDWQAVVDVSSQLNNSIGCLRTLIRSQLFEVAVLTHVGSEEEYEVKKHYLHQYIPSLEVIAVPKNMDKCCVVDCKNAILVDDFMANLHSWRRQGGVAIKFSDSGRRYDCISIDRLDKLIELYDEIQSRLTYN